MNDPQASFAGVRFALAPDGTRALVVAGQRVLASLHPYRDDDKEKPRLQGHGSTIRSVAWSPDGSIVASGDSNGKVILWNTSTWEIQRVLDAHVTHVTELCFSHDSSLVATGSRIGKVKVWNVADGQFHRQMKGHIKSIVSLAFSKDAKTLASGSIAGVTKLWEVDPTSDAQVLTAFQVGIGFGWKHIKGQQGGLRIESLSVDGTAAKSGKLRIGDMITAIAGGADGEMIDVTLPVTTSLGGSQHPRIARALRRFSLHDEVRLKVVRVDADSGRVENEIRLPTGLINSTSSVRRVAVSPNNNWLAATTRNGTCLWSFRDRQPIKHLPYRGYGIAFSPDNLYMAAHVDTRDNHAVMFWDLI